jgi:hypothetical protein
MNVAHGARGVHGDAEHPSEHPQPEDLVDESAGKNRKQSTRRTIRPDAELSAPFYSPSIACYTPRPEHRPLASRSC